MFCVPRLRPSQIAINASAYSAICRFRTGPAPRRYRFQSARNSLTGTAFCIAHCSPSRSTPRAAPLTTSLIVNPEASTAAFTSSMSSMFRLPAMIVFMAGGDLLWSSSAMHQISTSLTGRSSVGMLSDNSRAGFSERNHSWTVGRGLSASRPTWML